MQNVQERNIQTTFKMPFRVFLMGQSGCGKTMLSYDIAVMHDMISPFNKIILVYAHEQPYYEAFRRQFKNRLFLTDSLHNVNLLDDSVVSKSVHTLLILDDILVTLTDKEINKKIAFLLSGISHHKS